MKLRSHDETAIVLAALDGAAIVALDTANDGEDDTLIAAPGESMDELKGEILRHHERSDWPRGWTLCALDIRSDVEWHAEGNDPDGKKVSLGTYNNLHVVVREGCPAAIADYDEVFEIDGTAWILAKGGWMEHRMTSNPTATD